MKPHPSINRLSGIALLVSATIALGACSSLSLGEQQNAEIETLRTDAQSDYDILSCSDLAVIDINTRQRLDRLRPTTENRVEQEFLLQAQIREITANQEVKGCAPSRYAGLADAQAEPVILTPAIKAQDDQPTPTAAAQTTTATAATAPRSTGRFLQIGSFADAANAEAAADYFAAEGFRSEIRLINDGRGQVHRVLIGPLNKQSEASQADDTARALGVFDAFMVDG